MFVIRKVSGFKFQVLGFRLKTELTWNLELET